MSAHSNEKIPLDEKILNKRTKTKRLEELGTIEQAKLHSSAQRPLKIIAPLSEAVNVCSCCCLPGETKGIIVPFNFTDNNVSFSSTGIGTYLYFYFFQYIIFVAFIAMCMAAIPSMVISHHHLSDLKTFCHSFSGYYDLRGTTCQYFPEQSKDVFFLNSDWLLYFNGELFSYYKSFYPHSGYTPSFVDYNLINFLTLVVLFIINVLFLILISNEAKIANIIQYSPSDFSLLVDNVQNAVQAFKDMRKELPYLKDKAYSEIEAFQAFLLRDVIQCDKPENIKNINLCYKLKQLVKLEKQKQEIETKIIEAFYSPNQIELNQKHNNNDSNRAYYKRCCCFFKRAIRVTNIKQQKKEKQEEIDALMAKCNSDSLKLFADVLFITFDTIKHQEDYYNYFADNIFRRIFNFFLYIKFYACCCFLSKKQRMKFFRKQKLRVYHAPEPEDVIWENLELTLIQRIFRQGAVYAISILLIAISGGIVIGLNYSQYQADNKLDNSRFEIKYGVSFAISIAVTLVNSIFQFVLEILTNLERHKTKTFYYLSFSVKLAIFTFINSAVVPYVSNVIHDDEKDIMHNTLINNIFFIFISNSILTPALWLFNITFIYRKVMIWWLTRDNKEIAMSQKELNELYELPSMDISFKYSFLVKSIAMTLFYLPIFPLGVIITLFGLIFAYCIERFNFTKLYKRPEMLNDKICLFYVHYFIIILFAYGVGNWIFLADLFKTKTFAYINIIFFGLMVLFPYLIFTRFNLLKIAESDVNLETYDDLYFKFSNDYERMNPMTKTKGMRDYLTNLRKNNLISQEAFDFAIDNLTKVNLLEMYYKSSLNQDNYQAGNQMLKTSCVLNDPQFYTKSQTMRVDNAYNNQQQPGMKQKQSYEGGPLDQLIIRNFTFGFGQQIIPQSNTMQNVNANLSNPFQNQEEYNPFVPVFNPFMNNIIFNNQMDNDYNVLPQSIPPQTQIRPPFLNNNPKPQSNVHPNQNNPFNYNNNIGYSSSGNQNNNNSNVYHPYQQQQGYNSQDIQLEPNSNIPQYNSYNNDQTAYNPFAIMAHNNPTQKKKKQPDILADTYNNIENDTPGNPDPPLYNYQLGPNGDQPYSSLQDGSQRPFKIKLDPIAESNFDSNDIAISYKVPKKEEDSVIHNNPYDE